MSIARDRSDTTAAQSAALAVRAALNLYAATPAADRPKALEQLNAVAEFTEKRWPDRPEADDARMACGEAKLFAGQIAEAIEIFDRVNPKSERYPLSAFLAGQNYWRRYLTEKAKPTDARDNGQMASDRAKTLQRLHTSSEASNKVSSISRPTYWLDVQLLLAEVYAEGNQMQEAIALYQPLLDAVKAEKPKTLDTTTMRLFLGAIRAYIALNDLEKASQAGTVLMQLGPDTAEVNHVLIEFAKLLSAERNKADAQVTKVGGSANLAEIEDAKKRLGTSQKLLVSVLTKLAARQQLSLAGMAFVGDAMEALGMTAEAGQEYQKILRRAETDAEFAKLAAKATPRVRAQLIGALRRGGQFEEALKQVNVLIDERPRALEYRMEKGRILEAWAETEPTRYQDAVTHWSDLRNRLQQTRGKKPAEYYEVMYRVADCLVREAQTTADRREAMERARQAEQVLKSALTLYPALNGPEMVARYKTLLQRAIRLQGRQPKPE
jgi:tetratricopeptide (TPR) repeat protein